MTVQQDVLMLKLSLHAMIVHNLGVPNNQSQHDQDLMGILSTSRKHGNLRRPSNRMATNGSWQHISNETDDDKVQPLLRNDEWTAARGSRRGLRSAPQSARESGERRERPSRFETRRPPSRDVGGPPESTPASGGGRGKGGRREGGAFGASARSRGGELRARKDEFEKMRR